MSMEYILKMFFRHFILGTGKEFVASHISKLWGFHYSVLPCSRAIFLNVTYSTSLAFKSTKKKTKLSWLLDNQHH